ncbi:SxtJ family membrane protein [Larkinella rosea]|uniref:Uncharacterized protein n=1 Tax=Larkinella rosea TaxID=2025312 RepID=A0A3P1BLX9_9BACT|nr:SxtJ family membrane protein [Larkinella rosea]RRB02018.1 hypothetical protein EHT25_16110 [Larkinella rosea]
MNALDRAKAQLVIVTGLVILYFIFKSDYWLYAAAGVGLLSVFIPAVGNRIVWLWFKLAEMLGKINSTLILTVLFGLILTPIAALYRITTKNPLSVKKSKSATLFHERNHTYTKDDLEHPW